MSIDANYIEFIKNNNFEVLTSDGFKDFSGLGISVNLDYITIVTSICEITVTSYHQLFLYNYIKVYACDINIGDMIISSTGLVEVTELKYSNYEQNSYDLINVKDVNRYYTNGILSQNCLFLDEFAFVPDNVAEEFMASVYPTVASSKKSQIIIVSTPNGLNNFHHIWKQAVKGENSFKPIKVRWYEIPGYDEKFRVDTIRDLGQRKWDQEFACQFLGSSQTLIDTNILERIHTMDPIEYRYDTKLSIYESPEPGVQYVFGVDSGKGIGSDYSVIQVLKIVSNKEIKQVATYRFNELSYNKFAGLIVGMAQYYNDAMLMIEINEAGMGHQVAESIWNEYSYGNIVNLDRHGLGLRSNRVNKLAANMNLKKYLENSWLELFDVTTVYELSRYEEVKQDIFKASGTGNDDTVIALIWALYFVMTDFYNGKDISIKKVEDQYKMKEDSGPVVIFGNQAPEYTYNDVYGSPTDYKVF